MTNEPGRALRSLRERLNLKYRDVEEASLEIARLRDNQEFAVGLSRLADIENKGTMPSLYRLYSLCAIYGLKFEAALRWYSIDLDELGLDAAKLKLRSTRALGFGFSERTSAELPLDLPPDFDLERTVYLSPLVRRWGRLPLALLGSLDLKKSRYAFIGTDDWFMYPILPPGSFVQVDERKKDVTVEGWQFEHDRPIHLIEHRQGFRCGWCSERNGFLIVQPHTASMMAPEIFPRREIDVLGQIVGVAKRLDLVRRRHIRS